MDAKGMDTERLTVLERLSREEEPSPALEQRVTTALRREGLLHGRFRVSSLTRLAAAVATAAVLVAAGWLAGSVREHVQPADAPTPAVAALQPTHLLLLRAGENYRPAPTPSAARERVAEYRGWAQQEAGAGHLSDGYKLTDEVSFLTAGGGVRPDIDVQGLFLVVAESLDAAADIARRCPHLLYGGTIEVRPIEGT